MPTLDLSTKSIIVTGAGRGIGREMTLALVAAGGHVTAASRSAGPLETLSADAQGLPGRVETVTADVRQVGDCERIVESAVSARGQVDVLINNAGLTLAYIYPKRHLRDSLPKFWEADDQIIQDVIDTNYVAAHRLARMVVGGMIDKGWGRIIGLTTKMEIMNRGGSAPYGASKAAIEMSSEVWMKDLEGTGVTVNLLNPGAMATDGFASAEEREVVAGRIPLIEPARIGAPIVWLASDASDEFNGFRFEVEDWSSDGDPTAEARRVGSPFSFLLKDPD
jgi:NAD(P)-dependent dehydrogenase (short-subunit alcohol dehydrogenase family)